MLKSDITHTKNKPFLQKNEDAVSGFKGQIIQGSAINGKDVPLLPLLNSPEECQAACAADVRCQLWTYRKAGKKCLMKTGPNNEKKENTDAISGPKTCGKVNQHCYVFPEFLLVSQHSFNTF